MVRAEHLQQLWKEKYDEWLKRPKSKFSLAEIIPILKKTPGDTGEGEKAHKRQGLVRRLTQQNPIMLLLGHPISQRVVLGRAVGRVRNVNARS